MCGIATISIGREKRNKLPYSKLQTLIRNLLVELEPRGSDASGIAVINEGADSLVFKKPLRASRLVVRPMFEQVLKAVTEKTNFVMLHTRYSTVGSTAKVINNHPILIPNFVGIHNGTLENHTNLFKRHSDDFQRLADVDSEVIFQLFKHYTKEGESPEDAIKSVAAELSGSFTGAVVDLRAPHRMTMFKNGRVLTVIHIPAYDMVVTVSEAKFFKKALEAMDGAKVDVSRCDFVQDGTGMIFDVNYNNFLADGVRDFHIPTAKAGIVTGA